MKIAFKKGRMKSKKEKSSGRGKSSASIYGKRTKGGMHSKNDKVTHSKSGHGATETPDKLKLSQQKAIFCQRFNDQKNKMGRNTQ